MDLLAETPFSFDMATRSAKVGAAEVVSYDKILDLMDAVRRDLPVLFASTYISERLRQSGIFVYPKGSQPIPGRIIEHWLLPTNMLFETVILDGPIMVRMEMDEIAKLAKFYVVEGL